MTIIGDSDSEGNIIAVYDISAITRLSYKKFIWSGYGYNNNTNTFDIDNAKDKNHAKIALGDDNQIVFCSLNMMHEQIHRSGDFYGFRNVKLYESLNKIFKD